jgi:tetratricopeptide (TPR) repeat protein
MASVSQDYIKRMIEEIGAIWSQIVRHLTMSDFDKAEMCLDQAYKDLLHLDRNLIHNTSDDFLVMLTSVGKVGNVDKSLAMGELLNIEAEICEAKDEADKAYACRVKALNVLIESLLRLSHSTSSEHVERIDKLFDKLREYELPLATKSRAMNFYERVGRFEKAEDMLHDCIDEDDTFIDVGIAFYQRLLLRPNHELEIGGLPRDEVQDGLAELLDA